MLACFSMIAGVAEVTRGHQGLDGSAITRLTDLLQGEQLVDLLLNTTTVPGSQPLSHGEYFYSLFKSTINPELLKNLQITVPLIMKASSGKSTMVAVCSALFSYV